MASIADMERQDRLQGLWQDLLGQLPKGSQKPPEGQYDPVPLVSQGGYGQPALNPYLALRFLQIGQALGPMMNQPLDQNLIAQLIQQMMQQKR